MLNGGSYGTSNYSLGYSGSDDEKNFYLDLKNFKQTVCQQ